MQLCEVTLRQWMDTRNHSLHEIEEAQCLALFKKIVQGVEYIHSQGIVHHDIKVLVRSQTQSRSSSSIIASIESLPKSLTNYFYNYKFQGS